MIGSPGREVMVKHHAIILGLIQVYPWWKDPDSRMYIITEKQLELIHKKMGKAEEAMDERCRNCPERLTWWQRIFGR